MGRRLAWVGGGLAALIVLAVAVLWFLLQTSGAASVDDALEDFASYPDLASAEPMDGAPAPGVYTFQVTGEERIGRGSLGISRSVSGEAPFIIRTTDDGYETELRYSADHTEWVRYAVGEEGTTSTWGQSEVKALGIGELRPREWDPPPLRFPAQPAVGDSWSGTYKSGTLDVAIDGSVLREDKVEIGGESVPVVVIESVQSISGAYSGPRTEEFWIDPERNLIVRYTIASDLEGPIDFSITADHVLTSLTPLT